MYILYTMTIDNPNFPLNNNSNIGDMTSNTEQLTSVGFNWPVDIENSSWLKKIKSEILKVPGYRIDETVTRTIYHKNFNDRAEFDNWASVNKLTDPVLRSLLTEWDSTYNIVRTETVSETTEIGRSGVL